MFPNLDAATSAARRPYGEFAQASIVSLSTASQSVCADHGADPLWLDPDLPGDAGTVKGSFAGEIAVIGDHRLMLPTAVKP